MEFYDHSYVAQEVYQLLSWKIHQEIHDIPVATLVAGPISGLGFKARSISLMFTVKSSNSFFLC